MKAHEKEIEYHYRGQVERWVPPIRWESFDGYSATGPAGGVTYPWLTREECRKAAASQGCKAVFLRDGEEE